MNEAQKQHYRLLQKEFDTYIARADSERAETLLEQLSRVNDLARRLEKLNPKTKRLGALES